MGARHDGNDALLLEALSDKVLHQLPPAVWKELFMGAGHGSIHFEERELTLVHADAAVPAGESGGVTETFYQELQRINARHGGRLDPYVNATALVTFEEPSAAVRMAMELQQAATGVPMRVGVVSGRCMLAFFRAQGRLWCTPLGRQPARAAEVAATAAIGGIVISPESFALGEIQVRLSDYEDTRPAFLDSESDMGSLALDAEYDGIDIRC
ncbi:hypothetical protein JJ685_00635 [Ramlibacter monticola]|uniref:Uncharacterized protein n=1 Tax=Ramlibacter monticola TaxID=1926872 RepID=A0A936YVB3_9BURK|nr:hypothetical protein [Ramlibacter monticola]MBL0389637.1 hypothetical protein [Ramlibacter monticola]